MKKYAYEIEVINSRINALDDNGTVIKSFDLADAILKTVEAGGIDCNGCGLTFKK